MSSLRPVAHVVSHTHWDREWYQSFEFFRYRLVELMDRLLDGMAADPGYRAFHLDGQTIILEDYLQIHPERAEQVREMIRTGRLRIGPFYVLQDEFLVSGEANLRSLLHGHIDCERWGAIEKVGYLPDNFGNCSQMPQLLQGFGIDSAVFGRGVEPFRTDPEGGKSGAGHKAELIWRGADGSELFTVLMTRWYNNGMNLVFQTPEEMESALAETASTATASDILVMHGCDHQPVNLDIVSAIARYNQRSDRSMELRHSNLTEFLSAVRAQVRTASLQVVGGELISDDSDGINTLAETASSRITLKQANEACQIGLERWAEPLGLMAKLRGGADPQGFLTYAWRLLMQNHAHDSICGCSTDEVHREMVTRFTKVQTVVDQTAGRAQAFLAGPAYGGGMPARLLVFNTEPTQQNALAEFEIEIAPEVEFDVAQVGVVDPADRPVDATVEDLGVQQRYRLPENRFREVYPARVLRVRFLAEAVPPMGWGEWRLVPERDQTVAWGDDTPMRARAGMIANEFIQVEADPETGLVTLTDLRNGQVFHRLCGIEENGDIGDEYRHVPPQRDRVVQSWSDAEVSVRILPQVHLGQVGMEVEYLMPVPVKTTGRDRGKRVVRERLVQTFRLTRGNPWVEVELAGDNHVPNHRLRVVSETGVASPDSVAAAPFDVVSRPLARGPKWIKPGNPQRHSGYFGRVHDGRGLTIATRGLLEYEALEAPGASLCLTVLRCTGEIGDWYPFPTQESQCLGPWRAQYALIPGSPLDGVTRCAAEAYRNPPRCYAQPLPGEHDQHLDPAQSLVPQPRSFSAVRMTGSKLAVTAFKATEREGAPMIRLVNLDRRKATSKLHWAEELDVQALQPLDLNEQPCGAPIQAQKPGVFEVALAGKKILGFQLVSGKA